MIVLRKRFGQHFLHERGVVERIIRSLDPQPSDTLVEIGPGGGALTLPLLDRLGHLLAIELDRDLVPVLRGLASGRGTLTLIEADVLTVDFTALAASRALRLVGNLPYNISTPILFHALEHAAAIRDMHFMLQKEVVDRMAAAPGGKTYGRLTVMLQARCAVEPLFDVAPGAFRPPPKVHSCVVRLVPLPADRAAACDPALFGRVVRDAFSQRRKTLRNALSEIASVGQIESAGIDPQARAETVPVDAYIRLANLLASSQASGKGESHPRQGEG